MKWSLYPAAQPGEFVLIGLNYSESGCQLEPGQFRIQGEYQPSPVAGRFILYVGRNNVWYKGYTGGWSRFDTGGESFREK